MFKEKKILNIGTQVQLTTVDYEGFCGRDLHPSADDIGFIGFITDVQECGDVFDDICFDPKPGSTIGEDDYVIYEVTSPDGRRLDLVDYEFEVLK